MNKKRDRVRGKEGGIRRERRNRWRMKGSMVGGWQGWRERVKWRRDGLFYFQMAWLSGDDTFTESSHRISHWLHLPALPCCSLVKAATDHWFTRTHTHTHTHTHRVRTLSFTLSSHPTEPACHCWTVIRFRSGYSTRSPYGFPYNDILRERLSLLL